jgi:hypothetical protein
MNARFSKRERPTQKSAEKTATRYSCKSFSLQAVCKELKAVVNRVGLEPTTR